MRRKKRTRPRRVKRQPKKGGYPSAAERERIMAQRDALLEELIYALVLDSEGEQDRMMNQLVRKYGPQEVALVLKVFQESTIGRELIGEETLLYRKYRQTFARFGGNRRFLGRREYEDLIYENGKLVAERKFLSAVPRPSSPREEELHDLLFIGLDYCEDITPPDTPPRPPDFEAPSLGDYDDPVRTLLKWGWDLDERRITKRAGDVNRWRLVIPELVRMVLDEGLFHGWPGEPASWAPYHALHVLGHLQAHAHAGEFWALLDQEDDWLSDRLPWVWAQMGPPVEPLLWDCLEDRACDPEKRKIALLGLRVMAETHPDRRPDIVAGLIRHLQRAAADDAEMNGYIVYMFNRMQAVEASDAIVEAFEGGKVDTGIMGIGDVSFLRER
jgi:hypothetical protein